MKDIKVIERIKVFYPNATDSEVEFIGNEYKSYMRKGFDIKRLFRSIFRIFIVVIPFVAAEAVVSSFFFKSGSIAASISFGVMIVCLNLFMQTPIVQKNFRREEENYLASVISQYRSKKEIESGPGE